ncbi:MAG: hypothetical protein KGL59_08945 [Acidobacteriota bacterium]|nr:hypothetical protein [Acidobacteriota bacterium]
MTEREGGGPAPDEASVKAIPSMAEHRKFDAKYGRVLTTFWKCTSCGSYALPGQGRKTLEGVPCPKCQRSQWHPVEHQLCHWCPRYVAVNEMAGHLEVEHGEEWVNRQVAQREMLEKAAAWRKEHLGKMELVGYNPADGWPVGIVVWILLFFLLEYHMSDAAALVTSIFGGTTAGVLWPIITARKRRIK